MKWIQIVAAAFLALQFSIANAQEMSELTCEDFNPTPEALARFPDLRGACEGIVEREGELFAKFTAVVRRATNSSTTLYLPATDHTFTVTPDSSARVLLDGRKTRVGALQRGQEIRIYLNVSEFTTPDIKEIFIFSDADVLINVPAQPAQMLPKTAGILPTLALAGLGLLLLAGLLRQRRLAHARHTLPGLAVLALMLGAGAPVAEADSHMVTKPARVISSMMRTGAIVEKVDRENRELSLIDASGRRFTTQVGDEVTNFDEIQPRDRIVMEYLDSVAIVVVPAGTPEADQGIAVEVAGEGQKPAISAAETFMTSAKVLKLNLTERRATLQYEDGTVDTIKVSDDVPLETVAVGDEVRFRVTRAIAVEVRRVDDGQLN